MSLIKAKSSKDFSLSCPADQSGSSKPFRVSGYFCDPMHEAIRAYCWYQQISQSEFVTAVLVSHIEQLQHSGKLTPKIINLYRDNGKKPA